jgi:hypothetical protein
MHRALSWMIIKYPFRPINGTFQPKSIIKPSGLTDPSSRHLSSPVVENKKALLLDYKAEPLNFIHPPQVKVRRKNNWEIKRIARKYHNF